MRVFDFKTQIGLKKAMEGCREATWHSVLTEQTISMTNINTWK